MSKQAATRKNNFFLKNIDPIALDVKYSLIPSTFLAPSDAPPESTKIEELTQKTTNTSIQKLNDEHAIVSMEQSILNGAVQHAHCFWCRHDFDGDVVSCPVEYYLKQNSKLCTSEITKEKYIAYEDTPFYADAPDASQPHYETDGVFCSYNCCLAFVEDNKENPLYSRSYDLVYHMYVTRQGSRGPLYPAPHWRLLSVYGGTMSIDEFRSSFTTNTFASQQIHLTCYPKMQPIGHIYEKNYIF